MLVGCWFSTLDCEMHRTGPAGLLGIQTKCSPLGVFPITRTLQVSAPDTISINLSAQPFEKPLLQSAVQARTRSASAETGTSYDASTIQVLEGLEPVRKRPGMYIGGTGQAGLHHLVYEVLDNAIDEVQGGHATRVEVEVDLLSGWVTVTDDGRGIPTDTHPQTGKSALETVLTVLHAGGKFGGKQSGYTVSGGLHGVGVSVVNALSAETQVRVWRDGQQHYQAFSRGHPLGPLTSQDLPAQHAGRRGTQVRFRYDSTIFAADVAFDPDTIRSRLRELAFLNSNAFILLRFIPTSHKAIRAARTGKPAAAAVGSSAGISAGELTDDDYEAFGTVGLIDSSDGSDIAQLSADGDAESGDGTLQSSAADQQLNPDAVYRAHDEVGAPLGLENGTRNGHVDVENGWGFISHVSNWTPGVWQMEQEKRVQEQEVQEQGVQEQEVQEQGVQEQESGVIADAAAGKKRRTRRSRQPSKPALTAGSYDGLLVDDGWQVFHYGGGLAQFVTWMNQGKQPLHEVLCFRRVSEGVVLDVALQWCAEHSSDRLVGFVNSVRTVDGGTHLDGTRSGITRTINSQARKAKLVKEGDASLSGDCIREGLSGVISVQVLNPEFEGQTKTRLGNPEVKRIAESVISSAVGEWLELHPAALQEVVGKALTASRAVEAAKKARDLVRRKAAMTRTTLPGKLADCTSTRRDETELFVVEGDSAGGSAKQARDRHTQAILPLRGKILNVERKDEASMLKNNEIANLIVAMGLTKAEGCKGLRYGKVIILTDADVDGAHIRTLLLTFLFRFCRELFDEGHVYVAVPPLYKVEGPKVKSTWCYDDHGLKQVVAGLAPGSFTVQRFKGLGEMMPEQLWDTTLDPKRRQLRRLTLHDASKASGMFELLMGNKVGPRRQLIEEHASQYSLLDLDV